MTAGQQRKLQRVVHLAAAALLLFAYLYAPLEAQLQDAVRFIIFPLLVGPGSRCGRRRARPCPGRSC